MAHKKKPPPGGTDGGSGNNKAAKLDESRDNKADGQSSSGSYEASPLKRERATRAEMIERQNALYDIVLEMQPMTVRQVFYQARASGASWTRANRVIAASSGR
jgi:hypothetical protein